MLNKATTGRRLRPGALLIIYINIVRGANRLWGEMSTGRNAHGAKRLWGEMSFHGAKCPWGEMSVGRKVHKPDELQYCCCCDLWAVGFVYIHMTFKSLQQFGTDDWLIGRMSGL